MRSVRGGYVGLLFSRHIQCDERIGVDIRIDRDLQCLLL